MGSYHSGIIPGCWISRKRMQGRRVACHKKCGAKGPEFKPHSQRSFAGLFPLIVIMFVLCTCAYSVLGVCNNHCNSGSLHDWQLFWSFHFRIKAWCQYFKKAIKQKIVLASNDEPVEPNFRKSSRKLLSFKGTWLSCLLALLFTLKITAKPKHKP